MYGAQAPETTNLSDLCDHEFTCQNDEGEVEVEVEVEMSSSCLPFWELTRNFFRPAGGMKST